MTTTEEFSGIARARIRVEKQNFLNSLKSPVDKRDVLIESLRRKIEGKNEYIAYLEQRLHNEWRQRADF